MQAWRKGWFINIGFAVHQGARTLRCQGTPPALKWNKKTGVCINIPIWFTVWLRQRRGRQQPPLPGFLPGEKAGHREAVCNGPVWAKSKPAHHGCKAGFTLPHPHLRVLPVQALKGARTVDASPLQQVRGKYENKDFGILQGWGWIMKISFVRKSGHLSPSDVYPFPLKVNWKSGSVAPTPVENGHCSWPAPLGPHPSEELPLAAQDLLRVGSLTVNREGPQVTMDRSVIFHSIVEQKVTHLSIVLVIFHTEFKTCHMSHSTCYFQIDFVIDELLSL